MHATREQQVTELVEALRQCDGEHVQCLVMIRDDFWMAATRFMRELELPLIEGFNSNAVDLFPVRHARKVLMAFGRAFGMLPTSIEQASAGQLEFVTLAVNSLAQDGHVISVRLALFAEMLKEKSWVPATLKEVGGSEGVGVAFLEATFAGKTAPPSHRLHQMAARAVLSRLLPEAGIDIKGHVRSSAELLEASGYANRPQDLQDLIRILDNEVRLITPVDGSDDDRESVATFARTRETAEPAAEPYVLANVATNHPSDRREQRYQLTHDFLVPTLREWLTRKQKETRRGRAELQLAERSTLWNAKPSNRMLPSVSEFLTIRWLTSRSRWTEPQRRMMSRAGRVHLRRGSILTACVLTVAITVQQIVTERHQERVKAAIDAVQNNLVTAVPDALRELQKLPRSATLREIKSRSAVSDVSQRLRLAFAEAELGRPDVEFLCSQIGELSWDEVDHLVAALRHARSEALIKIHATAATIKATDDEVKEPPAWMLKARLAIISLHLGDQRLASDMCQIDNRPSPMQRTWFIEQLSSWHGNLILLAAIARNLNDTALRSAMCLSLASIPAERITPDIKMTWQPFFAEWFQSAPDCITHSAAGLPFFYWGLELPSMETSRQPNEGRDWFINSLQITLIKVEYGIPERITPHNGEAVYGAGLERKIFLSDREVAQAHFAAFMIDAQWPAEDKPKRFPLMDPALLFLPMNGVNCFDAMMFCNWLSHHEGYPPCYERTGGKHSSGFDEWRLVARRAGYRLPSEIQWEAACAAGTKTTFSFGNGQFFQRYVNIKGSGLLPGAIRLPNGWGFFDMHGNVAEWCHNRIAPSGTQFDPANRGGGFLGNMTDAATASRPSRDPCHRMIDLGFRVAFVPSSNSTIGK